MRVMENESQRLMDTNEIGFYVTHIDDAGFIRLNAAGGFDTRNLFSRRVLVCTKDDGMLPAVMNPGGRPIHIASEEDKKKIPEVKEFLVDLGLLELLAVAEQAVVAGRVRVARVEGQGVVVDVLVLLAHFPEGLAAVGARFAFDAREAGLDLAERLALHGL